MKANREVNTSENKLLYQEECKMKKEREVIRSRTLGQKTATAFWEPKATKPQAPQETLLTILLQPAPMNTLSASTVPFDISSLLCFMMYISLGRDRERLYGGVEDEGVERIQWRVDEEEGPRKLK